MIFFFLFALVPLGQDPNTPLSPIQLQPLFEDHGIPLAVMGLLVVFAALILVTVFITLLPRAMAALARYVPENEDRHAQASTSKAGDELSEELLVVIAAAVATVLDRPHRIVRTRELTSEDLAWSFERRMQHHSSHQTKARERW